MPCLRHTSAVFAPASCSCRIAMICSSLSRLRFIVRPPSGGRTLLKSGGASGAQVSRHDAPSHFLDPQTCFDVENDPDRLLSRVGGRMIGMRATPGANGGVVALDGRQTAALSRLEGSQNICRGGVMIRIFQLARLQHCVLPQLPYEQSKRAGGFRATRAPMAF